MTILPQESGTAVLAISHILTCSIAVVEIQILGKMDPKTIPSVPQHPVVATILDLLGGIRSTCTYVGSGGALTVSVLEFGPVERRF